MTDTSADRPGTSDNPPAPRLEREPESLDSEASSYAQILSSSALIGGATLLTVAIGIVRAKAMAMILGPAGFGLLGVFSAIADFSRNVAEMGINSSGVRQIAEAAGNENKRRLEITAAVLRRVAFALAALGATLMLLASWPASHLTFGDDEHVGALAMLSLAVFFRLVSDGQIALAHGLRRISGLALMGILSALFGTLVAVPIVYQFGEAGIVPSLVAFAAITWMVSTWYCSRLPIRPRRVSASELWTESSALLRMGVAFMGSGLLTLGSAYAVRLILIREGGGLESAGYFQAAWTVGGLYVGFVLQAMGTDFYPRLVAAVGTHSTCNRLVNEQTRVSLLLAGPGVLATLAFAPFAVELFYSAQFVAAAGLLRWICLGMLLRVLTWPMGYILIAQGRRALFLGVDVLWAITNVGLTWVCVEHFGPSGAGFAFFASYVVHLLVLAPLAYRLSGFRWSVQNMQAMLLLALATTAVFYVYAVLDNSNANLVAALVTVVVSIQSIRGVAKLSSSGRLPRLASKFFKGKPRGVRH